MEKFKVGDKFIPRKPKEDYEGICWSKYMDEHHGKTLTVEYLDDKGYIIAEETHFCFHPDWCEKVEEDLSSPISKSEDMVTGLKKYLENTPKEDVLKLWEALREEEIQNDHTPMKAGIEMISDEHIAEKSNMDRFPIENYTNPFSMLTNQLPDVGKMIDWEQRRYELAKELMAAQVSGFASAQAAWSFDGAIRDSILWADELIKQLKGE